LRANSAACHCGLAAVPSRHFTGSQEFGIRHSCLHHSGAQHVTGEMVSMLTLRLTQENDILNRAA
jgi:hypothetical protein